MGVYIDIVKLGENEEIVLYMFDKLIIEKEYHNPGEYFPYKVDSRYAFGFCTLNKKTSEFIIDKTSTDHYYFTEDIRTPLRVQRILKEILASGEPFPNITCYAS